MKKVLKVLGVIVAVVVVVCLGFVGYVEATYEHDYGSVAMPDISASTDPDVIAQGEYLVNAVAHCSACHGPADIVAGHELGPDGDLRGGFTIAAGPFGDFVPTNITPDPDTGIGSMSDGEIARVIRHGVDHQGRYSAFMALAVGRMSDEDLAAVISYIRSVPAIRNETDPTQWGFLAKALAGSFKPNDRPPIAHVPPGGISVERGEYLANGPAHCAGCHTAIDPMDGFATVGPAFSGEPVPEPDPTDPGAEFVVPNITPDPETGIMASWSEDDFVERFQGGRTFEGSKMPWDNFKRMTEDDLRSIYRYLMTVPPVKKDVGPSRRDAGWSPQ